jgi:Domain of unknown function (DUF4386)
MRRLCRPTASITVSGATCSRLIRSRFARIHLSPAKLLCTHAGLSANPDFANILASDTLFRLGIVSDLICAAEFVFLLWVLYRLFGAVNKTHASLMVILGLVFVPIMFVNTLSEIAALMLLRGADFLSVFDKRQLEALAMSGAWHSPKIFKSSP